MDDVDREFSRLMARTERYDFHAYRSPFPPPSDGRMKRLFLAATLASLVVAGAVFADGTYEPRTNVPKHPEYQAFRLR